MRRVLHRELYILKDKRLLYSPMNSYPKQQFLTIHFRNNTCFGIMSHTSNILLNSWTCEQNKTTTERTLVLNDSTQLHKKE